MNPFSFEVWRGNLLESVHRGRFAVVAGGKAIAAAGDAEAPICMRSSAKPFQAMTVVRSGAPGAYGFTAEELAVICGSHYGEARHVRAVESILRKADLAARHLRCGTHPPLSEEAALALARAGHRPTALHNNCSGKHAGMLAASRRMGAPLARYLDPGHPVQKSNRENLARHAGLKPSAIRLEIDGCSAPTFVLPLVSVARAFSRLGEGDGMSEIPRAMMAHPDMVGHPCAELMGALPGKILGKVGAEGIYGAALPGRGIGLAVKVDDGNSRPLLSVVVAIFGKLRLLSSKEQAALDRLVKSEIRNHAGLLVGRTRAVVD